MIRLQVKLASFNVANFRHNTYPTSTTSTMHEHTEIHLTGDLLFVELLNVHDPFHYSFDQTCLTLNCAWNGFHHICCYFIEVTAADYLRTPDFVLIALLQSSATNRTREARVVEYRCWCSHDQIVRIKTDTAFPTFYAKLSEIGQAVNVGHR